MRATNTPARHRAKKRLLKRARGFYAGKSKMYRHVLAAVKRAENQAFIGRKLKKRDFRRLWITRINIASRQLGLPYSRLIAGLQRASIVLNRKQLSELAIHQPAAFAKVVDAAKAALV
jgi:large subunit ribosomal protein L20